LKQQKKFKTFIVAGSFLILALVACAAGPIVSVGISDPASGGVQVTPPEGRPFLLPYPDTENYICYSPADHKVIVEYYKREIQYWKRRCE